jgi:hypothetical protein
LGIANPDYKVFGIKNPELQDSRIKGKYDLSNYFINTSKRP